MKLLKIFGLVLALHVVLIPLLFLSPGCQAASPRPASTTPANETAATAPSASTDGNWSSQSGGAGNSSSQLAPVAVGENAPSGGSLSGLTPAERARGVAPTRPDNPEAYISTTTPSVLAPTQPVAPAEPTTYTIRSGDNLVSIAKRNGTTVSAITKLNPGLKADALRPGQKIKLPASGASAAPAPSMSAGDAGGIASAASASTYTVKSGDTLSAIAARNGTTVAALRAANNLRSDTLQVGQTLTIPSSTRSGTPPPAAAGAMPAPATNSPAPAASGAPMTIELKSGDTLGALAKRYGITVKELMEANRISDPRKVRAGQSLVIPGFSAVAGSGTPAGGSPAPRPAASTTPPARTPAPTTPAPAPAPTPAPATTPAPVNPSPLDVPPGAMDTPVIPVEEPTPRP